MERRLGILQILASGTCFGFLGLFGKAAYERGLTPGELLTLRFLFGAGLLGAYFLVASPKALNIGRANLIKCLTLGVFGYAIFSSCYFEALTGLSASLTVLLLYTYPVMVAAGAWLLFKEKLAKSKWIALPLTMLGLVLLIWGDIEVYDSKALAFGVGSAIFYSFYILASSRWLKNMNALVAVVYIQLGAGIVLALLHGRDLLRMRAIVVDNYQMILAMALVCTVAAMSLFLAGLKKVKNWEASVLSTGEPVMGVLLAMLVLGESFSWIQSLGALAVMGAFLIVAKPS